MAQLHGLTVDQTVRRDLGTRRSYVDFLPSDVVLDLLRHINSIL